MGLGLSFAEGEGPRFAHPLRDEAAVVRLAVPDLDKLRYVFDAVASIRRALQGRVPLIGFSGSPWTLACYMVEGAGSDDYRRVKTMLYARPDLMHRILDINAQAVAAYLNAQIEAGAQAVMVFDSWGGVLADGAFQRFSLQLHAAGGGGAEARARRPARAVHRLHQGRRAVAASRSPTSAPMSSAWTGRSTWARRGARVGDQVALQGNLDPNVLFAPPEVVQREAIAVLDSFGAPQRADGGWDGHVFNLGHGISQHTPPEHVSALVDAVHSHSRLQRAQQPAASTRAFAV